MGCKEKLKIWLYAGLDLLFRMENAGMFCTFAAAQKTLWVSKSILLGLIGLGMGLICVSLRKIRWLLVYKAIHNGPKKI